MRQSKLITYRPITIWPGKRTQHRQRAKFTAKWSQTLELLDRELWHIGAQSIVLQMECDERDIRRDGVPRSDARPRGPGVILSFERGRSGHVSFPCDRYSDWQDNVRAIALSLEALRSVDRYGVTQSGEQYRGWAALPDRSYESVDWLKKELQLEWNGALPDSLKETIRKMAITQFHPDRNNGDDSRWKLWQTAAGVLKIEV